MCAATGQTLCMKYLYNNNYKHDNYANFKFMSDIKLSHLQQHVPAWYVNLSSDCAHKVC